MTQEAAAAEARRRVREHRSEAAAEARYHATLPTAQTERRWVWDEDHLGYRHVRCGVRFEAFIDPAQTTEHAVAHDKGCEAGR
ncbi:hypothetical protein ABZ234_04025 [Nocardiopsis sp. NPDC006198]|uniref:hypothetical protein n=1 Tax=Nocardiopsis sp. NPDC006198 TaxID=3154472 RepID=UPI0033BEB1F9